MGVGDICRQEINTQKVKNRAQPIRERGQAGETEKTTPGASEGRRKGRCWAPSAAGGLQACHRARHPSTLQTDDFTLLLHLTTTLGCCRSGQARPGWSRGPGAGGHTAPEPTLPASPAHGGVRWKAGHVGPSLGHSALHAAGSRLFISLSSKLIQNPLSGLGSDFP